MTQDDLTILDKGQQMMNNIKNHKEMLELLEDSISRSDEFKSAMVVLFDKNDNSHKNPLPTDVAVQLMRKARGMIEDKIYEMATEFLKI